ncbi:endonuclease/exonuclease/phosphatase family protein [Paenibacillus cymbidii]|uniref:endonuclease/exonuclease/phosphatase family protein n=1 Tax=Paenibacillus cymbidii TaxID=1639034 RepID=UPI0010811597|nr:endonuclease/exonuclease/phosphatase family protein [Paenibacillus cymbidii]
MKQWTKLRIMTYNIRHGKGLDNKTNLRRIAAEIAKAKVDVAALQEVDRHFSRSGFQDQAAILANLLGMHVSFSPSINFGWLQYGNVILSKRPPESKQVDYLPGIRERRSALCVKLLAGAANATVDVLNTHLGVQEIERLMQLPHLRDRMDRLETPAIVLGDFNMEADDESMAKLMNGWRKLKLPRKQTTTYHKGGEIDHIFVNMPLRKAKIWVQHSLASDHHPVIAELMW